MQALLQNLLRVPGGLLVLACFSSYLFAELLIWNKIHGFFAHTYVSMHIRHKADVSNHLQWLFLILIKVESLSQSQSLPLWLLLLSTLLWRPCFPILRQRLQTSCHPHSLDIYVSFWASEIWSSWLQQVLNWQAISQPRNSLLYKDFWDLVSLTSLCLWALLLSIRTESMPLKIVSNRAHWNYIEGQKTPKWIYTTTAI